MSHRLAMLPEPTRRRPRPRRAPPPYWFTESILPFPIGVSLPDESMRFMREDCTPGHWRAARAAVEVRAALAALVALGQFDLERFLVRTAYPAGIYPDRDEDPPPDEQPSPHKYLEYLRGRRVLQDTNARRLERTICGYAEIVAGSSVGVEPAGGLPKRSYRSVEEVAGSLRAPLLVTRGLYVKDRHIVLWQQPATEADWRRQDALLGWVESVRLLRRRTLLLRSVCFCHTVQLMYGEGKPGPPNERALFDRGGRRLDNGPW